MIPVATIFKPTCTCSKQLGSKQQELEELIVEGHTIIEAIDKLGFKSICCRSAILNASLYFIRSTNKGRIIDEIGHINRPSFSTGYFDFHAEDSPNIVLKKEPPNFPGDEKESSIPVDLKIGDKGTIITDIVRDEIGMIVPPELPVLTKYRKPSTIKPPKM